MVKHIESKTHYWLFKPVNEGEKYYYVRTMNENYVDQVGLWDMKIHSG